MSRAPSKFSIFLPITKVDEEKRLVYGAIAVQEIDNANEMFDYDTSKPYFEKWSEDQLAASNGLSKGNVRAMHGSVAAGKLTELDFNDEGRIIEGCAKVVDDAEWAKCLEGVYTGFSMGGGYVKRWQDGGITKYTAKPVEVSLVDKPCIKSATFSLVKADGAVEDRLFKSASAHAAERANKSVTGDNHMFIPTNDDVAARAVVLAKAAGGAEENWPDHMDAARDELVAEHDALNKADEVLPEIGKEPVAPVEETPADPAPEAPKPGDPEPELALKADTVADGNLEQVWKAKDGTTFSKKADAIAHNETLVKTDQSETLTGAIAALSADVAALNKADEGEPAPVEGEALDVRLNKFAGFLSNPDVLAKGLYEVSRLADLMQSVGRLYLTVRTEAAKEGDGSAVPASIMTAVEALGESLITMATEEVGEVMERLRKPTENEGVVVVDSYCYPDTYIALAASTMGLEKADAVEFFGKAIEASAKDKQRVQKIHDHAVDMGASCSGGDAEKLAKADGLATENEELKKNLEAATTEIAAALPLIKSLQADVAAIKAMPRPAAARTVVVEKGADANGGLGGGAPAVQSLDDLLTKFTPDEIAKAAIRVAQRNGQTIFARNNGEPGTGG